MSTETIKYKEVTQTVSTPGKPKGLKFMGEEAETQIILCEKCDHTVAFNPDELWWDSDEDFEFCDVVCPECNKSFEINATEAFGTYDFFTT